jgi:hypothetical protein
MMINQEDIQIAIEWIFEDCLNFKEMPDRYGCLKGKLEVFKKHPKDFINVAKRKMAKVI